MKSILRLAIVILLLFMTNLYCQSKMVVIRGGEYKPLYGNDSLKIKVTDFLMDVYPVSNKDFLEFVKENSKWKKSKVKKLFADKNYLKNWNSDTFLGEQVLPNSAVTNISWFAANDYCMCKNKRLPTVDEWEYVAMSNEKLPDARKLTSYNQYILNWYDAPKTVEKTVGSTFKNYWGVYDMHGLIWEWTLDFNSVLVSGESRKGVADDGSLFCGAGAIGAKDLMNYAAFMRYAVRSSLKARYTLENLGFRCVKDIE